MRITILGAGPAGLYAAILLKRARPGLRLRVIEQNAAGATIGFGVVFSDQALGFLRDADADTAALIEPHMQRWSNIVVVHRGRRIVIDGVGFTGIGRQQLLQLLRRRAAELGVEADYDTRIDGAGELESLQSDLLIGADGAHSVVRGADPEAFAERLEPLHNRFAWYGAARQFDALTQTFVDTPYGPMNAHHYSYAPGRSTFIVEMTPATFAAGFDGVAEAESRTRCEQAFSGALRGTPLLTQGSPWRRFTLLHCRRWHAGRRVLIGDALHTAHFSIGSGTRLALEDAAALVAALDAHDWQIDAALPAYQATRQPVLDKLLAAARRSAQWYERFDQHLKLPPHAFALSYIHRAGRLSVERLRALAPRFVAELERNGINPHPDAAA